MALRGPCSGCRRHIREDARACPFCKTALPALPPRHLAQALALAASTLIGSSALAQAAAESATGDAAVRDGASDAGTADAARDLWREEAERPHPVYGMPSPPGCGGCGSPDRNAVAGGPLGLGAVAGVALLTRRRRKKRT